MFNSPNSRYHLNSYASNDSGLKSGIQMLPKPIQGKMFSGQILDALLVIDC
jgi:hypothetical protein